MGNSNGGEGSIYVRIDKPTYLAGEMITGTVFLNLSGAFQGDALQVSIRGKEKSYFERQETNVVGHSGVVRHSGKVKFYDYRQNLYTWTGGMIPPGQYAFPFQFVTSPMIPGSIFHSQSIARLDARAEISYKVKAKLMKIGLHSKGIVRGWTPFAISEPIKTQVEMKSGELNTPVTFWCCFGQGNSLIRCTFEKNAYTQGETANILCEIDNSQCQAAVQSIFCKLMSKITVYDQYGERFLMFGPSVSQEFPGIGPRETAMGESKRFLQLPLIAPAPLPQTVSGGLVRCEYVLMVRSVMNGCTCCHQQPQVEIPITIYSLPPEIQQIQAPQAWNPTMMPTATLTINYAPPPPLPNQAAPGQGMVAPGMGLAPAPGMGLAPGSGSNNYVAMK